MPRILAQLPESDYELDMEPEFLMIHSSPAHIWAYNEHFIQSDNHRAELGKGYYWPIYRVIFRVIDISENDEDATSVAGIENGHDVVTVETLYAVDEEFVTGESVELHRYQLEVDWALSMGDTPMVPFDKQNE